MIEFDIKPFDKSIQKVLIDKVNNKTKPVGSLGRLEELALQIGTIQQTVTPELHKPSIVVFAGDHGIAREGIVNPYPQEVTSQMVYNFLNGGAAINTFCDQNNIKLKIVDSGVNHDFDEIKGLINAKIGYGTKNYEFEPAMSLEEMTQALSKGSEVVSEIHETGTNIIGFGEMGIGNTSSASLIAHCLTGIPLEDLVGRGTGLDNQGLMNKLNKLIEIVNKQGVKEEISECLAFYGGFEIAMMTGAFLKAAELQMTIMVDGFICTAALLAASKVSSSVLDYCVFMHHSQEKGHRMLLEYLNASPLLSLDMRLGEGSGIAVGYPLIKSSVTFLNEMASFESAAVSQSTEV